MTKENMNLLDEVIKNRLEQVRQPDANSDEDKQAFREAMEALNKKIELEKIEVSHLEQIKRMEMEEEQNLRDEIVKVEEAKKDRWVQIALFVGGALLVPAVDHLRTTNYIKKLCNFEKDYTFTTSAGRGLTSSLFRFKK